MEGRVDQSFIDHWQLRRLVRGDGRPGRGRSLEEEDDDEYQSRMEFPPDYIIAAVTRLAERQEKTAELSAIREDNRTQHEWGTTAAGLTGGYASRLTMGGVCVCVVFPPVTSAVFPYSELPQLGNVHPMTSYAGTLGAFGSTNPGF
jgi:hypothetical protein